MRIPFNKPCLAGPELSYIAAAIESGKLAGDGEFTRRCEAHLERELDTHRVLLTTSGTDALELAAILLDVREGDEVIVPSFTFSSTVNAFCLRGARPVFVDIRPDTMNLDETCIERAITPRTRAVVPVHYAGVGCAMDTICEVAARYDVAVVEDAAQGIFSYHRGRALGTIGQLGCFSFHETKTLISGEGGAICINDPALVERAEIVREKGANRAAFFRGEVDKYTWVDIGSSFLPSELNAAFLLAQLEGSDTIIERRRAVHARYRALLSPLADAGHLVIPQVPSECEISYHMFHVLVASEAMRAKLIGHLKSNGIAAVFHYVPLHSSPMGKRVAPKTPELPMTDDIASRLLRLPMYNDLSDDDIRYVAAQIGRFFRIKHEF